MILHMAIADYLKNLKGKSEHTRIGASRTLHQFADWCNDQSLDLAQLKTVHLRQYAQQLQDSGLADSSQRVYLVRLKAFFNWCSSEDTYDEMVSKRTAQRVALPKTEQKIITIITDELFTKLHNACANANNRFAGHIQRNRAILAVLMDTGLRVSELCSLTLDQVCFSDKDSFVRTYGKGRKWREV